MAAQFDPYAAQHIDMQDSVLERSFEASKRHFWNDTDVLDQLIAKHGRPQIPAEQRASLAAVLSSIYHGEIVALHVSASLLGLVDDLSAQKVLAAQVIEEAKHIAALSRYVREAELNLPPIDPWARRLLEGVRQCNDPVLKLLGMQLLTENIAHAIFRTLCDTIQEPVLKSLLDYIDRDEVKHVGLARNYLPKLLAKVRLRHVPRMWATQTWWSACLLTATWRNREHGERLGIDINAHSKKQSREVNRLIRSLGSFRQRLPIAALPNSFNDRIIDFLYPPRQVRA